MQDEIGFQNTDMNINTSTLNDYIRENRTNNDILLQQNEGIEYVQTQEDNNTVSEDNFEVCQDDALQEYDKANDETDSSSSTDSEEIEYLQELEQIEEESKSIEAAQRLSQENNSKHVPVLGAIYQTPQEAYQYYNTYALIVGFSITKYHTYKCKDKKDPNFGKITRRTYKCNMYGRKCTKEKEVAPGVQSLKKSRKKNNTTPPTPTGDSSGRKTNKIEHTQCPAEMIITLEDGVWTVTRINLEHNHHLVARDQLQCLFSQSRMNKMEYKLIKTFSDANVQDRKIMAVLSYIRGGTTPYNKKKVSNTKNKIRNESSENDMSQVMQWFSKMQAENPMFYYTFDLEEKDKVKNIFWANADNRRYYEEYGEFISFDTTYNTNRYNMKFAPFVGVTGHGDNCLFGCAFLKDETAETFEWVFKQFLECMAGKHPKTIITDQDMAMRAAIRNIFPNTIHQNCYFHIAKKIEERGGRTFAKEQNKKLHADLFDILRHSLTEAEFEKLYKELPQKYELQGFKYLEEVWKIRKNFAPVYFKQHFFPFVISTARSEGTNSLFKLDVGPTYSVMRFMNEYKRIAADTQRNQRTQDYITKYSTPTMISGYEFEEQAAKMLNRKIFYKFQKQIGLISTLMCNEIEKGKKYAVYKAPHHRKYDFRTRKYLVTVDIPMKDYACICCKFQKDGILCAHVLKVLDNLNIFSLDEKYFINRWRPKTVKQDKMKTVIPEVELRDSSELRYNILCRRLCDLASDGAKTMEKFNIVLEDAEATQAKINDIADQENEEENTVTTTSPAASNITRIRDPDFIQRKGRPPLPKRTVGILEQKRSKQTIRCSHCQENDHNIATCKKLHLPPTQKKRKKNQTTTPVQGNMKN